jgi:hypothetical protein
MFWNTRVLVGDLVRAKNAGVTVSSLSFSHTVILQMGIRFIAGVSLTIACCKMRDGEGNIRKHLLLGDYSEIVEEQLACLLVVPGIFYL